MQVARRVRPLDDNGHEYAVGYEVRLMSDVDGVFGNTSVRLVFHSILKHSRALRLTSFPSASIISYCSQAPLNICLNMYGVTEYLRVGKPVPFESILLATYPGGPRKPQANSGLTVARARVLLEVISYTMLKLSHALEDRQSLSVGGLCAG